MKKPKKPAVQKHRSAEALAAWRLGHRIKPSVKTYSRKDKHRKPRPDGGASSVNDQPHFAGKRFPNTVFHEFEIFARKLIDSLLVSPKIWAIIQGEVSANR